MAAFESAGLNLDPDAEEPEVEMSMEEMLYEHLLDQLIQEKQQSLAYQSKIKDQNINGLRQADQLRRKLGG